MPRNRTRLLAGSMPQSRAFLDSRGICWCVCMVSVCGWGVCVCKTASYLAKCGRVATNEVVKSIRHAPIATNIHWHAPIVACKCCLELLLDNGQRSLDSLLDLLHCSRRVCNWWRGTCTSTRACSCSRCCCSSCWWHGGSCWNSCCCCCCCGCHGVCVVVWGWVFAWFVSQEVRRFLG